MKERSDALQSQTVRSGVCRKDITRPTDRSFGKQEKQRCGWKRREECSEQKKAAASVGWMLLPVPYRLLQRGSNPVTLTCTPLSDIMQVCKCTDVSKP